MHAMPILPGLSPVAAKSLTATFDAGRLSSDGGLIVLRDGVAERYLPARNAAASPYRFELETEPENWFLEDDGYELAVFHSHISAPPRPSRTDVENIGLWEGRPYLILSLGTGELAAWRITGGEVSPLELQPA